MLLRNALPGLQMLTMVILLNLPLLLMVKVFSNSKSIFEQLKVCTFKGRHDIEGAYYVFLQLGALKVLHFSDFFIPPKMKRAKTQNFMY